ncbi:MAG: hypothetical protein ACQR33_04340 [Candidatus Saccharibacteria bacterium]
MENKSIHEHAKDFDAQIRGIVSHFDLDSLTHETRRLVADIKRLAVDVRLDVRDYEYAQTRAEQLGAAHESRTRLEQLHTNLLAASEQNLFSAVDVAQLSALIHYIISELR